MQRPHEEKRQLILATAARMFATHPFHKVRLDDIAAEAHVGKGTLYVYFENKEDLYFSLIYDGFSRLVEQLKQQLAGEPCSLTESSNHRLPPVSAIEGLQRIIAALVSFALKNPYFYEMVRSVGIDSIARNARNVTLPEWDRKRHELQGLVESTIRHGVQAGELDDPHPELTAGCIPGLVRSVMLFGPKGLGEAELTSRLMRLLEHGIAPRGIQRRNRA